MSKVTDSKKIEYLKQRVLEMDNEHCFIEKERYLAAIPDTENKDFGYYARLFAGLLDVVSVPVDQNDIFVGRVIEDAPDDGMECPSRKLFAKGHLIPDYERLLTKGYRGILSDINEYAKSLGTEEAAGYAENAKTVIEAIRRYALRYSQAAREAGNERAADALLKVPYEPAYDLYSALQGIWLVHMISSCYAGARDYAFGYIDEYLYPYYLKEKERGADDCQISYMLAGFFLKTNEICGRTTHNYKVKPVLCKSSKQYVLLDGGRANRLSELILDAAVINSMPQPQMTVVLSENFSEDFKDKVFDTMAKVTDKLHVYNKEVMSGFLGSRGLPEEIKERPAVSACCTFDIATHACREEFYLPTVQIFCDVLFNNNFSSKEELLAAYAKAVEQSCFEYLNESRCPDGEWTRMVFVLDCLLLSTCNELCKYPPYGLKYRAKNIFLPGIATLGDSLQALDKLVFKGDIPYGRFIDMLKADFVGYDDIYSRIVSLERFGNDTVADNYAVEIANALVTAVENTPHADNEVVAPSFYSLERNNVWASEIPATPDGRRQGTPISENQSPTYGADKKGLTALLSSVAKLPFERTAAGGLNLTFSSCQKADILKALITAYFKMGGMHAGITVLDRNVLLDAMKHPEKYPTLTVRLYGFSEYFISLPEWQQIAVLERTEY